ncbi:MAG: asparagine synthase (glutamine-hydrolyzing) [Candidatus Marinimicrobia bacterium]|nr:asparagine synthase (glutamine-hydrolyzing) [Candidatus Neomarinimicrobiota bacterium]
MCGITGFTGKQYEGVIANMNGALTHRGPDDEGFFVCDDVSLGMRRLSIIDVGGGQQPVFNEHKSVVVVFNGEIYNFSEIKKRLLKNGHKFATNSDTEVIAHLYEEKGEGFVEFLNGMFAIALWDKKKKKLILTRDRLGEKPLYYFLKNKEIIFGSELKALFEHPSFIKDLDLQSLSKYLIYEYVPSPHTIFKNVYKLGPGEILIFSRGEFSVGKYWDAKFNAGSSSDFKKDLTNLGEKINSAVKSRMVSDVPLGVFLSGGLDSSIISYYAQKNSKEKIKTFSIGFSDKSFDESEYARQVANFLGTDHYEKILTSKDCLDLIPQISDFLDEPMADASIVPTFLLSKLTKEKVTVALSGDGGDELFMGYPTFQAQKLAKIYEKIPTSLRSKMIEPVIRKLPTSLNNISFDFKLKKFISGLGYIGGYRNQIWLGSFFPNELKQILSQDAFENFNYFEDIDNHLENVRQESLENKLIYLYLKNYLQDDILVKTDRASMATSLESRAPLLDHDLVEFVNSLSHEYKLHGWKTKYILKELMKDKLPKNIVCRKKKGFGIPVAKWIRDDLKDFTLDLFEEDKIKEQGIFNYSFIKQLLDEHFSGKKDNRKKLWTLMIFQMWYKRWF